MTGAWPTPDGLAGASGLPFGAAVTQRRWASASPRAKRGASHCGSERQLPKFGGPPVSEAELYRGGSPQLGYTAGEFQR